MLLEGSLQVAMNIPAIPVPERSWALQPLMSLPPSWKSTVSAGSMFIKSEVVKVAVYMIP